MKKFSELLGDLYDVVANIDKWENFLECLSKSTNSSGAYIADFDLENQKLGLAYYYGLTKRPNDEYSQYVWDYNDDPRPLYLLENPNKPVAKFPKDIEEKFLNSRVYREHYAPAGVCQSLNVTMPTASGRETTSMGVWRGLNADPYSNADYALFSELVPHVRRVIGLQRQFLSAQFKTNPALDILETLPIGTILCDPGGRVHFANRVARYITRQKDGLNIRHSEIWCGTTGETSKLLQHIRVAAEAYAVNRVVPAETMTVQRSDGQSPLLVVVGAVTGGSAALRLDRIQQPVAVVYVSDPDLRQETSGELLQRMFGLTVSESNLVRLLVSGLSLKEAARQNEITEGTARGYLNKVYSKTNTRRQSELVSLVANSPAWLKHQSTVPVESLISTSADLGSRRQITENS